MITEIPASGFVLTAMSCLALLFWVALVPLRFVRPRFLLQKRAVPYVMLILYFVTPLSYAFGHFALYRELGGLPAWGKIEGAHYFLGKAGGEGYVEVSHGVYSFFFWFELVGFGSILAMGGSAAILGWLGARAERKAASERLHALCERTDVESLYGLIELIGSSATLRVLSEQDRLMLRNEVVRRTGTVDAALKPPLSLVAPPEVLAHQKELWARFVRDHETEIIRS